MTEARLARGSWIALAGVAVLLAIAVLLRWASAVARDGPILYGEGAVAHAALLARDGAEYADVAPPAFVAANYTPLFFHVAGLGDPFVVGRLVSIASVLAIAVAIGWRARRRTAVAVALAAGWIALAPVALWGPAVKPDPLVLALTVGGVLAIDRRMPAAAALLFVLACMGKPTAALPAVAMALVLAGGRAWGGLVTYATVGLVGTAAALIVTPGGVRALREHVIDRNALAWDAQQAFLLAVLAVLLVGAVAIGGALARPRPAIAAYLAAGVGVLLLGGREGATVNYALDLTAAGALALADAAPRLSARAFPPLLGAAQLVVGALLIDPYGLGTAATSTGAWGSASRLAVVRSLPAAAGSQAGPILAEDAGLLVASGREVVVDDLFLWSRLVARGAIDPAPLAAFARAGAFGWIVAETDLERLDAAPAYERQRWPDVLASAVRERYVLDRREGGVFVYRPR